MSNSELEKMKRDRDHYWDQAEKLFARNKRLAAEIERKDARIAELEADKRRMDYLESEAIREIDLQAPRSLFRRNMPITREAVDEALTEDN